MYAVVALCGCLLNIHGASHTWRELRCSVRAWVGLGRHLLARIPLLKLSCVTSVVYLLMLWQPCWLHINCTACLCAQKLDTDGNVALAKKKLRPALLELRASRKGLSTSILAPLPPAPASLESGSEPGEATGAGPELSSADEATAARRSVRIGVVGPNYRQPSGGRALKGAGRDRRPGGVGEAPKRQRLSFPHLGSPDAEMLEGQADTMASSSLEPRPHSPAKPLVHGRGGRASHRDAGSLARLQSSCPRPAVPPPCTPWPSSLPPAFSTALPPLLLLPLIRPLLQLLHQPLPPPPPPPLP